MRRSGGESCRSSVLGGGSVDGGAGHCPDARGAAVQAACGLLGSGEDADGRAHLPLPDTVVRISVDSHPGISVITTH